MDRRTKSGGGTRAEAVAVDQVEYHDPGGVGIARPGEDRGQPTGGETGIDDVGASERPGHSPHVVGVGLVRTVPRPHVAQIQRQGCDAPLGKRGGKSAHAGPAAQETVGENDVDGPGFARRAQDAVADLASGDGHGRPVDARDRCDRGTGLAGPG
jgi:hypothetical protein